MKYYYVIQLSRKNKIEIPINNVSSLEECDTYTAENYKNKEDLYYKVTGYKAYDSNTRVYIKEVKIKKDKLGHKKQETRNDIIPIYQKFNSKDVLKLCRYTINNEELITSKDRPMLIEIKNIIKKEEITYEDIRNCYFLLKQINQNIQDDMIKTKDNDDLKEEERIKKIKSDLHKKGIDNYIFPSEEEKNYGKHLKQKILSSSDSEEISILYHELLDFLGGYEYNNPLSKKRQ